MSGVPDVVVALVWLEVIEERADAAPETVDGALWVFSEQGLELGEDHLNGAQIRRIGRQQEALSVSGGDRGVGVWVLWARRLSMTTMSPGVSVGVNRRYRVTLVFPERSSACRADQRPDPTPIYSQLLTFLSLPLPPVSSRSISCVSVVLTPLSLVAAPGI